MESKEQSCPWRRNNKQKRLCLQNDIRKRQRERRNDLDYQNYISPKRLRRRKPFDLIHFWLLWFPI